MSAEKVKALFAKDGLGDLVRYSDIVSPTVETAAEMLRCQPRQIAKTMSLMTDGGPIVVVMAGDARIDNVKYRRRFSCKAKMIHADQVEAVTGHEPGGITPFALNEGVAVYLDESLRRFELVYAGGGDEHHTVGVTLAQLEQYADCTAWVDVCKGWQEE